MEVIAVQACKLSSKLRNSIRNVDKKIEELNSIFTALYQNNSDDSTVSEFFMLKKDQKLLKPIIDRVLTNFLSSDHQSIGIVPTLRSKKNKKKLIRLKKIIEKYKKKEEEHSKKLRELEAKLVLDKRFSLKEGSSHGEESEKCLSNPRGDLKINQILSERTDNGYDKSDHDSRKKKRNRTRSRMVC